MSTLSEKRANRHALQNDNTRILNNNIENQTLVQIHELEGLNSKSLDLVNRTAHNPNGQVKIGTTAGLAVAGGEQAPVADPDERAGWLFTKALADTAKFNYFHYGQGSQAMLLSDLTALHSILTVDAYTNSGSLPFFNVFTLADGSSPNASWYKSKLTYSLSPGQHIILGESVQCWSIYKPIDHTGKRFVEFNTKAVDGAGAPGETIQFITIHSDSSAPAGTQILVQQVGYNLFTGSNLVESRMALIA